MALKGSHAEPLPHVRQEPPAAPYSQVAVDTDVYTPTESQRVLVDALPLGGGVLFTHKTLHASMANTSDAARWSLDIRYSVRSPPFVAHSDRAQLPLPQARRRAD